MDGTRTVHDPGSVLVVDGVIAAVGSPEEVARHPAADSAARVDAAMHAVMPGMHNAHLHSGLLRGTAESMALWEWLENHIDPAHRALTPEIARAASYMAYTEAVRGGTTSVLDMWRFMEGSARGGGRHRDPGDAGAVHRRSLRLLRVTGVQSPPPRDAPRRVGWPRPHLGRTRAHLLLLAGDVPRGGGAGGRVRHGHPHPLLGVDLGGRGVPAPIRSSPDRGDVPARHPRVRRRSSPTPCGSTIVRSRSWRRPARR